MFLNGKSLLEAKPIKNMVPIKTKFMGTSYGLSEAGYDIRIKQRITFIPGTSIVIVDGEYKHDTPMFTLASAIEEFQIPNWLVATIKDKSTWARKGLSVFNTVAEPGWNGFLTLELVYHGSDILHIHPGQGIAQVLFGILTETGDYGDGKYQNQEDKPIHSKV